jgi:hypothetical protein
MTQGRWIRACLVLEAARDSFELPNRPKAPWIESPLRVRSLIELESFRRTALRTFPDHALAGLIRAWRSLPPKNAAICAGYFVKNFDGSKFAGSRVDGRVPGRMLSNVN